VVSSVRASLALLVIGATAGAASCDSREEPPVPRSEAGGASSSGASSGAGTSPGGQVGERDGGAGTGGGGGAGGSTSGAGGTAGSTGGGGIGGGGTSGSNTGGGGANGGGVSGGSTGGAMVGGGAGGMGGPDGGSAGRMPTFVKRRLNAEFYSEGINYGDLDGDGNRDIIAGPYWYPGPEFTETRTFRQPRSTPFDVSGDSDCYTVFVYDFNQDGWLDVLSFRLPGGAEAVWYENPQGAAGNWAEHVVYSTIDNESATFTDVDGDGRPELVTLSGGYGGFAQPDWTQPEEPWTFHRVTNNGGWARYTHGMGVGDVNGDGRLDLLLPEGFWEQPEDPSATPWASTPATFWAQEAAGESYGGAQMFTDDVDGDGDADVITSLQAHGWGLAWFEQTGAGFERHMLMNTRDEEAQYGVAFAQPHALELADLDGDGLKDLVTGKRKGSHGNGLGAELDAPAVLYWFRLVREPGQPPRYEPQLIDSEAGVGTQVVVADVNEDGLPDILTAARAGAFLFLNQ
jgi:hypothetical protein